MTIIAIEMLGFGLGRLAQAAKDKGETLTLMTRDPKMYHYELANMPAENINIVEVETFDAEAVKAAIRAIPDVKGMLSATDTWSLICLDVAEALGLQIQNPDAVRLVRDKHKMRNHLFANGLSAGNSFSVDPANCDIDAICAQLKYPVMIKDAAGTGSQNVWMARSDADTREIIERAKSIQLRGLLTLETYFFGTLYSAESVSWDGETRVIGISGRTLSDEPDFMEMAITTPVLFAPHTRAALDLWLARVLETVGYTHGFSHLEFIVTETGFEVVEINPRMGGVQIGEALARIYDASVFDTLVEMALGQRPAIMDAPLTPKAGVAQVFVYAGQKGTYEGIGGLDMMARHPGSPQFYPYALAGAEISNLTDQRACVGIFLAGGETSEIALLNVLAARAKIQVGVSAKAA